MRCEMFDFAFLLGVLTMRFVVLRFANQSIMKNEKGKRRKAAAAGRSRGSTLVGPSLEPKPKTKSKERYNNIKFT